ncbi:hypothetical protein [Azospirillum doebereinerae]
MHLTKIDEDKLAALRALAEERENEIDRGAYRVVRAGQVRDYLSNPDAFAQDSVTEKPRLRRGA